MTTYHNWKPTQFDSAGLNESEVGSDWLVLMSRNRDSDELTESNWSEALELLGGESETVSVHSFNHWACGWFEIILVKPDTDAHKIALEIESRLEYYPVLNEVDWSNREHESANQLWRDCYRPADRVEYIRKHRSQFEFQSLADMLGCVRGNYFCGYASELIH